MSDDPATTGQRADVATRFAAGVSGNPAGRPLGARHRLAGAYLEDLYASWQESGRDAIDRACKKDPVGYLNVIGKLLPRNVTLTDEDGAPLAVSIRRMTPTIEATDVETSDE